MDPDRLLQRVKNSDVIIEQTIPDAFRDGIKIFVVGPPRSGTTLIYSMIANEYFIPECTFISTLMKVFEDMYKFSDDERFYYYGHNLTNLVEIFKKPIYDFLFTATLKLGNISTNRYVFKDPILTLYLDYFKLFFDPSFKIVFCIRDPRDVVSSMLKVLKKQNPKLNEKLFNNAIDFIFPFYNKISNIHNVDDEKIIFVKYEDIVTKKDQTIDNLEKFLGFTINSTGVNENIKDRIDVTSEFYSTNFGKAITTSSIGRYRKSLSKAQIIEIERVFTYYMQSLNYD